MAEERHLYTVLSNLKSNREETKGALQATTVSLIHDHNKGRITDILQLGLLHSLVGLIRCTADADILYIALQLLSVLTHGSDEMRLELARMKIVSVLLPLLTPPQEKSEWEWIPVQEMVLTALRKITFHCEANQAAFIKMGGSSLVVKLCKYDQNKYPPETTER
uniref:Uncharacterized protein n=1 Tax=Amphimedon queenslandica TaxID=400682 RepID=A0A1X7U1W2_AMPQE